MKIITAKNNKLSLKDSSEILSKIRDTMKKEPIVMEICKEQGHELSIIDGLQIRFSYDIDVSAKTINSEIELNSELLFQPFDIIMRYAIHEFVHALQHMDKEGVASNNKAYDYLDNPDEIDAFKWQEAYHSKKRGPEAAKDYIDELVEYHEYPAEDADEKAKELKEKI